MSSACYTCTVDVNSSWFEKLSLTLGSEIEISNAAGGYKIVKCTPSASLGTGEYCFLQLNENMAVIYTDVAYHIPLRINFKNPDGNFILLHFSPEERLEFANDNDPVQSMSRIFNQITLMDCSLKADYESGSETDISRVPKSHALRIIIKREYAIALATSIFDKDTLLSMQPAPQSNSIFYQFDMDVKSKIILEKFSELKMSDPAYAFYLLVATFSLITTFYENLGRKTTDTDNLHSSDIMAIQNSMETINSNLESQFPGIEALAKRANMSGSKYKRLFTQIYGDSPKKIYVDKKIDLGRELLLTGNYNVSDVVYQLGYSNKSFFSLLFKRRFGVSPGKIIDKK
ncbi:AraC-like DNA-binding protein [Pedobacter cryoconitis]|uniref:helix-turn-helix domain-containing protein n=1 Tax=Pedobacter cryoconitis TaxID=188932 RepID=UPI00160EFAE1|nr:helix-turn-helix domain-containing protein [Pedobacter cryoconitis]MBB6271060.1 AraC-like DNA-binding protein [Pedobacter cryoconitis]